MYIRNCDVIVPTTCYVIVLINMFMIKISSSVLLRFSRQKFSFIFVSDPSSLKKFKND